MCQMRIFVYGLLTTTKLKDHISEKHHKHEKIQNFLYSDDG